jgi:hypothetical protein
MNHQWLAEDAEEGEWHEDEQPTYRSLSLAQQSSSYDYEAEYDGDDHHATYRSLCVAPAVNPFAMASLDSSLAPPQLKRHVKKPPAPTAGQQEDTTQQTASTSTNLTEPPKLCVLYQLEPHTHLYTSKPVAEVVSCISDTLEKLGAVFQFKAGKHKFKCDLHARSSTVNFHVRLWKSRSGECIVEAQKRRSGDSVVLFCDIWRAIKGVMTSRKQLDDVIPLDTLEPTTPAASNIENGPPPSPEAIRCGLSPFVDMMMSRKIEIQRNGLHCLDMTSSDAAHASAISESAEAVRQLCVAVGSTDSETRTRALRVISNLLMHSYQLEKQLSSDVEKQIIAVIQPIVASLEDSNINLNVQAARTLKCISAAVHSSKSELTKCGALSKMQDCSRRCSELQYTARPMHCLAQMQKQIAANISICI